MSRQVREQLTLYRPVTYEIKVPGHLNEQWTDWNGTLTITITAGADDWPITTLTGVMDQAGLQGLLRQLYAWGLPLLSARCLDYDWAEIDEPAS